jgi:hypothetical protein
MIAWFVVVTTIIVGSLLYDRYQPSDYDVLAVPYIKTIVPEFSQWDSEKARALMVPEVSSTISEEKFSQIMTLFSRLGALQSMAEPKFEKVYTNQPTNFGSQIIIEYEVDAKYTNGDALISVKLLEREGSLQIYNFNISSELLVN